MARSEHANPSAAHSPSGDPQAHERRARNHRFARRARCSPTLSLIVGLACLAIAAVSLPAAAFAAPQVTVKAKILPVLKNPASPKGGSYPKTGNILGAGASVEAQMTISGTEYGGFPSPLTGVVVYLPSGTKLHPQGFTTCSNAILESHEVQNCPKKSIASPKGEVLGVVSFGASRVQEKATVQAFFTPGGNIAFFTEGREPTVIEILSTGRFSGASNPFSQKLTAVVPLVSTVPGAPYASVLSIKIRVGAAFMQGKKLISYGTVPKKCPKGGFPAKTELKYLSGETSTVSIKVPCPKK
ncbi:MAG TPA: hypothetical protein VK730_09030 [Solirubrobacteraceae bacterium]|jgi:hypothetical protein|nr:hypothetical protein [Solirubrobacteraceae bacterium]